MKKMYATWIFLISVLFIAILYIGYTFIDSISLYQALENDMVEAADFYLNINKVNLSVGEEITISSKQLLDDKTLNSMTVDKDECKGYVRIKRSISNYDYQAFIKCTEYQTEGYEE